MNATTGVVEDIIWAPGASRSDLPIAVLVSCPSYSGPTLWRTRDNVPIIPVTPVKSTFEIGGTTYSRTQIPLRLAWAVTVHKSQGLTLGKVRLGLGSREFATGLTFVALSRVKQLDDILLMDNVDYSRVRKLGGKFLQYRFEDYTRRYNDNQQA